tara:strand:- start:280 stop:579 length:300 start_codon:yes stop_codon:yes gene_type:complete
MPKVFIQKSDKAGKKLKATFLRSNGSKKTIHFGQAGAPDYTITKDKAQRKRYLDRHRKNENWNNAESAGALSRWILWGPSTSRRDNIKSFKKRFGYVNV